MLIVVTKTCAPIDHGHDVSQYIAENVRYLRESMALTRERLAEYIGSSASQIGALESGRTASPGFFVIERLAQLSGVSTDEFVRAELRRIGRDRRARRLFELELTEAERLPVIRLIEGTVGGPQHQRVRRPTTRPASARTTRCASARTIRRSPQRLTRPPGGEGAGLDRLPSAFATPCACPESIDTSIGVGRMGRPRGDARNAPGASGLSGDPADFEGTEL